MCVCPFHSLPHNSDPPGAASLTDLPLTQSMEEAPELISPRISFSHDLVATAVATLPPPALAGAQRPDASLLVSRLPEPEFDFANALAAADDDVTPADRLFAGGRLLPMPPLPPAPKPNPNPCKQQQSCSSSSSSRGRAKAQQACKQRLLATGSWASSPFSRSSSVNSAATTTTGAPRSAGRFGCPTFPLMRSWSVGSSAAVADAASHRPPPQSSSHYKKFGGAAAASSNGGGSRAYYYGGSRKGSGSSGNGVRVRPVLNVTFIGTSVSNALSYLLCDCSHRTNKKSREFYS